MTKPQPARVTTTAYLQVEPRFHQGNYWRDEAGNPGLEGAAVIGVTQRRPEKPRRGVVVVKVELDLPSGVFLPLRPQARIVVPDSLTALSPVEATAVDAGEDYPADSDPDRTRDLAGEPL